MPKPDLDAIDCRIIAELQSDARLSNVELADKVGLSPSPCLRRVKRLEREGDIGGYRAALQRDRVGLGFSVSVGVKLNGHANDGALAFEKAVVEMPEVVACHLVLGEATISSKSSCLISPATSASWSESCSICRARSASNVAIQTLKASAPLLLEHLNAAMSATSRAVA